MMILRRIETVTLYRNLCTSSVIIYVVPTPFRCVFLCMERFSFSSNFYDKRYVLCIVSMMYLLLM